MTQEHTPEPWIIRRGDWSTRATLITTAKRRRNKTVPIAEVDTDGFNKEFGDEQKANARRIVACVNACAAIPTDELEKAAADPIAGMFGRLAGKSVSQRDHAVRALSQLLSVLDDPRRTAEQTHDALEAARSAVATITGVQP